MRDQIIEKLRAVLSDEMNSECKVVYVLCETRKLLDKYPPDPTPIALKLYCHWALHVDLTHAQTTLPLLKRIDEFVESVLAGSTDIVNEHRMFREFLYWDTFRQQFRDFLSTYDLPAAVCDDDPRWGQFLKHYAGVIQDGSLSCRARSRMLKHVAEVVFNGPPHPDSRPAFDYSWDITLLDGRGLTVDVSAASFPDGNPMLVHGISIR